MIFTNWETIASKAVVYLERFYCDTAVIAGSGAVSALAQLGAKRLLVVTDPFFYENGVAAQVAAQAKAEKVAFFYDVKPDPSVELAAEGTALVQSFQPDVVVALGGGSAMDCAKAMIFFAEGGAKLVAIPTTSGSGSEVTDFAILTHGSVKHPLVDEKLRPAMAILDGDLLGKLPKSLIADGGFDVLSHAVEAIGAKNAGAVSDALAKAAFGMAFHNLGASYAGDTRVRLTVHKAATMAGMAFSQAGLGVCHAMAHSLGGVFHVPHGRLNAILLPTVVGINAEAVGEKYADLARAAGLGGTATAVGIRNLKNGLIRLRKELGLPATLVQAGVNPGEVRRCGDQILAAALADPCCATNPVKCDAYLLRQILDEVTGRG
jgi:alcohol dehydrogenase class IV